jgi:CheY-like chemotaxis protein
MAIMDQMKILLVDDSKSARYALRLQLQRHGVEVETADSAESAFEMLKGELPDAILMDHMMPGLNGFEALDVIRADNRTAHIPVVMCSSHEDPDFAAAAKRKGVAGILPKSVAPERLPDVLDGLRNLLASEQHPIAVPAVTRVAPAPAQPATPAGLSEADVARLVEERVAAQVDARVEKRLGALLGAAVEDLRRDLEDRVLAETRALLESRLAEVRHEIEAKLADERLARDSSRNARDLQELEEVASRFVDQALPTIVKIEIEAERAAVLEIVEQYVRERVPQSKAADLSPERLAAIETSIAEKALDSTKRAAQEIVENGVDRLNSISDTMARQVHDRLRKIYIGIGGAALTGVLAAVAVYFLRG